MNPRLTVLEPSPVPDTEPAITARLANLLEAASGGRLRPEEFGYVRAGFFPETAEAYRKLLGDLGAPRRIDLLDRREAGDDRIYRYEVAYAGKTLRVTLGLAPDGQISVFGIRPE
jgi:hypothetical protein